MRTPKVTVSSNRGRCILKFVYLGNFYSITQGDYNNPADREYLEKIALQIKEDIRNNSFDGVERYRTNAKRLNKAELIQLLEDNPIDHNLAGLLKHLKLYSKSIRNKGELKRFFGWMPIATSTKRRYYTALRKFPEIKEFCDFEIKAPKDEEKKEIDPFTQHELSCILESFKGSHYYNFVYFISLTGCRPSEAIGITWDDIEFENKRIRFHRSLSKNQLTGKREYKTTKTSKSRYTPMSPNLVENLLDYEIMRDDTGRVFSTPEGDIINDSNFLSREWKPRLKSAGVRYRPPYNLRHTFISQCLSRGVTVATVAKWVGNSPEVIYKHYAGSLDSESLPELY